MTFHAACSLPHSFLPAASAFAEEPFPVDMKAPTKLEYKFKRRETEYDASVPPGTIIVDNAKRLLFHVHSPGQATRYGVAVGKGAKAWSGEVTIAKMTEWPRWFPAPYHLEIKPDLKKWLPDGMPGGADNPMGARAMYLYKGKAGHHQPHPWSRKVRPTSARKTPPAASACWMAISSTCTRMFRWGRKL